MKGNSSIDNKGTSVKPTTAASVKVGTQGNGDHKNGAMNGYDTGGHGDKSSVKSEHNVTTLP